MLEPAHTIAELLLVKYDELSKPKKFVIAGWYEKLYLADGKGSLGYYRCVTHNCSYQNCAERKKINCKKQFGFKTVGVISDGADELHNVLYLHRKSKQTMTDVNFFRSKRGATRMLSGFQKS